MSDLSEIEVYERVFEGLRKTESCMRQMAREFVDGTARHKRAHDYFVMIADQLNQMIVNAKTKRSARAITKAMNETLMDQKIERMKVANGESPTKH